MLNNVKLANGTEVTWEEFIRWSARRQAASLRINRGYKHTDEARQKIRQAFLGKLRPEVGPAITKSKTCPFQTPNGLFNSRKELEEQIAKDRGCSFGHARNLVSKWRKLYPTEYYYIKESAE